MKINHNEVVYHSVEVIKKIDELKEKYRSVFWTHIDGELFVYKPVGRKDYRDIMINDSISLLEKEDEIVKACLLYPEDIDLDDYSAGVSTELFNAIMKISYLEKAEDKFNIINYYREEMYELPNQITCLINEAFPQFDIEDIENWDIEKTAYYLSRAEWKLVNLRGMEFNQEYFDLQSMPVEEEEFEETKKEENNKNTKNKLTPEKLRELQMKIPEINWAEDSLLTHGEEIMNESVNTMPVALRPR